MIIEFFKNFKAYINNFEYDLVILSSERIAIINQEKREYIEYNDSLMMKNILEYIISTEFALRDVFEDSIIKIANDEYLKLHLHSLQQIV